MLIGITGPAGCGKDTVGEILRDNYGFNCASFARPIQKMVCNLLGYDVTKWLDREWRETIVPIWKCTPRHMAQTLGTEWGRKCIRENIWLDLCLHEYILSATDLAITDLRFPNEAFYIRSPDIGGYIIHVHRAETDAGKITNRLHSSELGVGDPYETDFHINNFGTIEELAIQVGQVVDRILELKDEQV